MRDRLLVILNALAIISLFMLLYGHFRGLPYIEEVSVIIFIGMLCLVAIDSRVERRKEVAVK